MTPSSAFRRLFAAGLLAAPLALAAPLQAQSPCLRLSTSPPGLVELSAPLDIVFGGTPGDLVVLFISPSLGPTVTPLGTLDLLFGPDTYVAFPGAIPPGGVLTAPCPTLCGFTITQAPLYAQAAAFVLAPLRVRCISNLLALEFVAGLCDLPCVIPAVPDPLYSSSQFTHSFYLGSLGTDYEFQPAGELLERADGTATLRGTIVRRSNTSKCFTVDLLFGGRQSLLSNNGTFPPPGSPKQGLDPSVYAENGGPIDPLDWHYYETTSGTLAGCGAYAGALIKVERRGPSFQVGFGANDKNLHFGASGWLKLTTLQQPTSGGSLPWTFDGDINVDLTDCQ